MKCSSKDIGLLLAGLLPAVVIVFLAFVLVPGFIAVYAPVASELPSQAKFVFSFYYLCAALPALVMCVWLFWRKRLQRGVAAASFGIVGSIALGLFGWWATYQPQLILELVRRSGS
jgi:hypothetical protein